MQKKTGSDTALISSEESSEPEDMRAGGGRWLDPREQTTRNLKLIGDVIQWELNDELLVEQQVEGVRTILLPVDDVELAHANLDMALRFASKGDKLSLQIVPPRRSDADTDD
jgi:hypothetical protein